MSLLSGLGPNGNYMPFGAGPRCYLSLYEISKVINEIHQPMALQHDILDRQCAIYRLEYLCLGLHCACA